MARIYTQHQLKEVVSPVAKRFGVKRVYMFGSYARQQAGQHSDLDLRIDKGEIRSLFQLSAFRLTLEETLSIPVDIVTSDSSDKAFLARIHQDEVLLYES